LPRVNVGEVGRHGPAALVRPAPTGTFFTVNLLRRLNDYADIVLRFTQDPATPFTINLGEWIMRMFKVKQKGLRVLAHP